VENYEKMATQPLSYVTDPAFVYGQGADMHSLNVLAAEIARTDIPVLLVGESGTGKDVYARLIHRLSGRSEASLTKINCAALDAGQLLNEVRAAFQCAGIAMEGETPTVFLDGVHELDAACQRVLLSLLPDGESAMGSVKPASRVVSSTSCNFEKEIEAGRFRLELYFRINGVILRLPPLRHRKEDIPDLLECFLVKHANELKKNTPELSRDDRKLLFDYDWPGNSRVPQGIGEGVSVSSLKVAARAASRRTERELILKALEQTHWNRKRAARDLQISYKSLLYKIKQIGAAVPVPSKGEGKS
jgi:two-component system response regulator AtoC